MNPGSSRSEASGKTGYNRFLLLVAGLGGLLYGIDVGIISGALPYLQATFKLPDGSVLSAQQSSLVVAAVFLGTIFSTLVAGAFADLFGRRTMLVVSGLLFVVSVPVIALAHSYDALVFGRLLQGISVGFIGVVAPLYLAECLSAANRGQGTGVFQWLLTLGIVAAAIIGFYFSRRVEAVSLLHDPQKLVAFKDAAWRGIFWVSLPPGVLFVLGTLCVAESPRWLFRRGKKAAALRALLRSRSAAQAAAELQEMETVAAAEKSRAAATRQSGDSLLQRKYVLPFLLACVILACNQATGVNSLIGYNVPILIQAGLSDQQAHFGYVILTVVNFLMTIGAIALVDRKGRKFLLSLGSAGVIVSLLAAGLVFRQSEKLRVDRPAVVQSLVVQSNQTLAVDFHAPAARQALAGDNSAPATLIVIYSYGDFHAATKVVRSDDPDATIAIDRDGCVPVGTNQLARLTTFLQHPFANLDAARLAPLKIEHALITPVPSTQNGWLTAVLMYCFMACFAVGPGVCVWLALSELMPTRIRSNGMSFALVINQAIATVIAGVFLPTVGQYGYSTLFFIFAGCTVVYFITAAFFLPETRGKTLEEIEAHFAGESRKKLS